MAPLFAILLLVVFLIATAAAGVSAIVLFTQLLTRGVEYLLGPEFMPSRCR